MSRQAPIRLTPSFRQRPWGRKSLHPWFPDAPDPIGEVWYLSDCELPLLVKLIFTAEKLSVQVHPDDGDGVPRGKTEMWHILEAQPGAAIALGFREPLTRQKLLESTRSGKVEGLLNWIPVSAGETYFTPARTVHAIGSGIVLCEIQQNCDVTYRLWDYGRPREIHVEQAVAIADLGGHPGAARATPVADGHELLVRCPHFVTEAVKLRPGENRAFSPEACHIWICLQGQGRIGSRPLLPGEAWLIPDELAPEIEAASGVYCLRTYTPQC